MNITKTEFKTNLLLIADHLNCGEFISSLFRWNCALPELTKILISEIFLKRIDENNLDADLKEAFELLHEYIEKLTKDGFVEFK